MVMARQAGVLHIQIDTGKRGAEYHFPIKISFWLKSCKMPVKFVLTDANITRTTGENQANAIKMALNDAGIPLAMAVTLGGDNTNSILVETVVQLCSSVSVVVGQHLMVV